MKNQKLLYLILHCLFLCITYIACTGKVQQTTDNPQVIEHPDTSSVNEEFFPQTDTVPGHIEGIQKVYGKITEQLEKGVLDSTSFTYNCRNEIQGRVTYFSHNGKLRMIQHNFNKYDHHAAAEQFYTIDSTLFFVFTHTLLWSFDSGPEGATKDNITEQRVYFVDQKPVRCLEKKYIIRSAASTNPQPESIPNKEVTCSTSTNITEAFEKLVKYRFSHTKDCL